MELELVSAYVCVGGPNHGTIARGLASMVPHQRIALWILDPNDPDLYIATPWVVETPRADAGRGRPMLILLHDSLSADTAGPMVMEALTMAINALGIGR